MKMLAFGLLVALCIFAGCRKSDKEGNGRDASAGASSSSAAPTKPDSVIGQAIPAQVKNAEPSLSPTDAEVRIRFSGTFRTPVNAKSDISITFAYPKYILNPSSTFAWKAGTTGTWDVRADSPLLKAEDRSQGWRILSMTAPDDPTPIPARVHFAFDAQGNVREVRFASFLGKDFPPNQQMVLSRSDLLVPASATVERPAVTDGEDVHSALEFMKAVGFSHDGMWPQLERSLDQREDLSDDKRKRLKDNYLGHESAILRDIAKIYLAHFSAAELRDMITLQRDGENSSLSTSRMSYLLTRMDSDIPKVKAESDAAVKGWVRRLSDE